jgi:hypothetical protein
MTGNLVLDNTGVQNFKAFMRGKEVVKAGSTVTGEAITAPAAGNSFLLAEPIVSDVTSITSDPVGTTFAAGTDYVVDGRVIYVPAGSTMAGDDILVNYTAAAAKRVEFFGVDFKEYFIYFQGRNTANNKRVALELFKVSFDPATLGNLLGDEVLTMTVAFEALFEPLKSSSNLGGFGSYTIQD